jgi:hypothetical protein
MTTELRAPHPNLGAPVHLYPYTTKLGKLLYWNARFEPKDFRPVMPDGRWILDSPRVLYRLPDLFARGRTEWVWVCEGEKDADNLAEAGLLATTAGSASAWRSVDWSPLAQCFGVILVPDCDDASRKWAEQAATDLYAKGSRKIIVLDLGGTEGYDATDYLEENGVQYLELLRFNAPYWKWRPKPKPIKRTGRSAGGVGLPWDIEDIVYALGGTMHGDSGKAWCPAHMDEGSNNTGLSLRRSPTDDDRTLVNCFSGCEFREVAEAIKEKMQ